MNYYNVPKQHVIQLAIEESVRLNACLIIPYMIEKQTVLDYIKELGYENEVEVYTWNECPHNRNHVFLRADNILQESFSNYSNQDCFFVENS